MRVVAVMAVVVLGCARTSLAGLADVYWAPTELSNTLVWLDASDANTLWADTGGTTPATTTVARWDDRSGNGNHMLQANTSYQPVTGSGNISNVNAIAFDGSDDKLQEASNAFGSTISNTTVFMVIKLDATSGSAGAPFLALSPGGGYDTGERYGNRMYTVVNGSVSWDNWIEWDYPSLTNALTSQRLIVSRYSVSEDTYRNYVNGYLDTFKSGGTQKTANGGITNTAGIALGPKMDGVWGELIVLDSALSDNDRQLVEGYLAWKWEFVGSLPADHPYKLEPPNKPPSGTVIIIK